MQNEGFRLSPEQRRFWLLQQTGPAHRAQCALIVEGALRPERLRKAVQHVVDRHEILRTTFPLLAAMKVPYQVVNDSSSASWSDIDLTTLTPGEQDVRVDSLFEEQKRVPFDFEHGPLLQICLITLSVQKHALFVCLPSLCADAVTLGNLVREMGQWYAALESGDAGRSDPLQYADFSAWQEELLQKSDDEAAAGKQYWREQDLASIPPLLLPFVRKGKAPADFAPSTFTVQMNRDLSARLNRTAGTCGISPSALLLACWQTLLWRHTRQADIVVATVFDGRKIEDLREALGLFAKTLPVHCRLEEESKFSEVVSQVDKILRDVSDRQEYFTPEKAVDAASLPIAFQFDAPWPKCETTEAAFSVYKQYTCGDRFTVKLRCFDTGDSLGAEFHYDPDKVVAQDIERLAQQFHTLLTAAVDHPQSRIDELKILSDLEHERLIVEWNATRRDYPKEETCVHHLFEQRADQHRTRIAVVYEEQQLTYAELNARANQLAHHLRSLGVGPEIPVGICVERSPEMIVGLLGVLKAGGAYVPLDPLLPKERLRFMLEDTQVPVLLTQERLVEYLPKQQARVVCLDRDWNIVAEQGEENLTSEATSKNLAYVLFTSGSTGEPKGVAVEHQQLLNYLHGILERLDLPSGASFATVSTFAADLGNTAIFPALCTGGCLHVLSQERASDPNALADYFARHPIDCLKIVPSHLEALLNSSYAEQVIPRKRLVLGGEACSWKLIEKLAALAPDCVILNHYGPTETTIGVATYRADNGQSDHCSLTVPIGRPITNTAIYLLDSYLRPVPMWVPGELYIAGDNVTRGYLNRPELTAEKFIPNPFSSESNVRLYKTGDVGRYLPDGNIEFLGRIDAQVKVRGFRIELGEIEAVLGQHPAVRHAVIAVQEDANDKRLVAFVQPEEKRRAETSELRIFLKSKLPEYMLPSAFVMLDRLPLTRNGKVDRRALPAPDQSRLDKSNYVAPRNPVEELLAEIWADVLKRETVGIEDNFFDLGGHSLLATRLISRVRDAFRLDLPLRSLFEAPTVAGMAKRVESARAGGVRVRDLPILPEGRGIEYPLSFSQERFWFLDQLEPNNLAYKVTHGFRLSGHLDVEALERSLGEIVRRHESLRTTFHLRDGKPVQRVREEWSFKLTNIDLRQQTASDSDADVQRLYEGEHRRPFDLSADLLLRASLLRLGADEHVLLLNTHHIAWDHWSIGLFFRELSVLYQAFAAGRPSPLAELAVQYKHYALWQRTALTTELENHLTYWKQLLADASPALNLPIDRPRKPLQNRREGYQTVLLSKELTADLQALSRKAGVTFFMTLLAAFQTLLHRLTGEEDIVVGTPVAGRHRSETENLIGLFLNSLALRTRFSDNPTILELLARVRDVALGAYDHQELPFEKLVEELQPERDLSRTPIFQVFINLYNFQEATLELDGLSVRRLARVKRAPQFDIELYIREHTDGMRLTFVYDSDLFEFETIKRMLANFEILLEAIASKPQLRVSDLPILTDAEKHQLLVEWNYTDRVYPNEKCIHHLFEEQVEKTPDALAIVFGGRTLNYRELNAGANQLAHRLRKLGVAPDMLVGVFLERSIEMVVALLGILKAGGAYVPLDPEYPKERLFLMVQDAQLPVLLTQEHLVGRLPESSAKVICLDRDRQVLAAESVENLPTVVTPENLAYVIYTSGSTGQPKGAMNTHQGICNRLLWMQEAYQLTDADRVLQKTPFSFDVSVWEFFWPLLNGARLVVVRPGGHQDSAYLVKLIFEQNVTTLHFVPSMLQVFLEEPGVENCGSLKRVICSGEALPIALQERFFARLDGAELNNLYGPTEAAVDVTFWACERESKRSTVPIGRPIANTQIYILDRQLQPVPIGVPGELCIGGVAVGRGYLNRPELTAEKFIQDPFSNHPYARLYKTGDLARYLSDGNIEFLGRMDHQVKIRGFRIELGEIEAILSQHSALTETVVVAQEDAPGDKRLVAYCVLRSGQLLDATAASSFLKQKLPEYMVPSAFVFLQKLPRTANGKTDRKALPAPDHSRPELEEVYVAPRTPVEEMIAQIWAEVLKLDTVGVHDNFFNLGGHSLLATQAMARICQEFNVEVPLRALFERPTTAELADRIEEAHGGEQRCSTPQIRPLRRDKALPLSFSQQRLWFLDQYEPNSSLYNIPSALRLRGSLNIGALEQSLNEIIRRHESLRTTFSMVDGDAVQVIAPSVEFSLAVVDLSDHGEAEREEEARRLVHEEARRPFDLAQGPLFRSKLVRLSEDDHVLLLTMHHIVSDGWSMGILYRELSVLYEAFSCSQPSPLSELPIQYADYAVWEREWLQGEVLDRQLSYWKNQLEGISGILKLPTDRPQPAVQSYRGARQSFVLSKDMTEQLKDLSRREGVTLFMTLLAAFKALLYAYTGETDLVIGSPTAGRNRRGTEGLIGFFVNTLILRTDLSGNPSFRELVRHVREVCLGAYAHQELPYQKLVEALQPKRGGSRGSLAQVFFAFQNVPRQSLKISGITVTPIRTDLGNAKSALTVFMWEAEQCLAGSLNYAADLFNAATINRVIEHFHTLLTAVVADPEQRLRDLPEFLEPSRSELLEAIHWATEQSWHFESDATVGHEQGEL